MRVRVRRIQPPYTDIPTESLQAILCNHAHNKLHVRVSIEQLYEIMGVLADRREAFGFPLKSDEEALAEFKKYYMPKAARHPFYDYASGLDYALQELSDVLPASLYDKRTSKL